MAKEHTCPTCGKIFDAPSRLKRHLPIHDKREYECPVCNKKINSKSNLDRHIKAHDTVLKCDVCDITFKSRSALKVHIDGVHGPNFKDRRLKCADCKYLATSKRRLYAHAHRKHLAKRLCPFCLKGFKSARSLHAHQRKCQLQNEALKYACFVCRRRFVTLHEKNRHVRICRRTHNQERLRVQVGGGDLDQPLPQPDGQAGPSRSEDPGVWEEMTFAMRGDAQVIRFYPGGSDDDLGSSLIHNKSAVVMKLREHLKQARGLKWSLSVSVEASREREIDGEVTLEKEVKTVVSETRTILVRSGEEEEQVEAAFLDVLNQADNIKIEGSSWVISHINYYELTLAKYTPLKVGSYIKTPIWLSRKHVIVNVKTINNHECFRLSILASLYPPAPPMKASDPSSYTAHYHALDFGDIDSNPMAVKDIKTFCKLNPDFSLSVIGVEKEELFPLICPAERKANHITLLMLSENQQRHFVLCTSLETLLYSKNKHQHRKHFCLYCFSSFVTKQNRESHERECKDFGGQKIKYPTPGSCFQFGPRHIRQMSPVPFLLAYDFETLCVPVEEEVGGRKTIRKNIHVPFCYCVVVVDFQGTPLREPIVYSSGDPEKLILHFLDTIFAIEEECFQRRPNYPISMSVQQEEDHERAVKCWICERGFTDPEDPKVRDHSPLLPIDNWLGASHRSCNVYRSRALFLPAICHNSAKFDMHMILPTASKHAKFKACDINILPHNMEVYRQLTLTLDRKQKRQIRFIDSCQHFATKLSDLLEHLSDDSWALLRHFYPDAKQHSLLMQKGVMCYDFLTSFKKVEEQKVLPSREDFFNKLNQEAVSEEDYERAERVWRVFECKSLLEYVELYCKTDVIGLMVFFLHYRDVTASEFGYEVCHFVSTPSLSLACAVKHTKCQIPLITDPDMFLTFEKSIRGGLSGAVLRHAKANNCGTPDFKPEEDISHIIYTDVNALYSYCLAQNIPVGDFIKLSSEECASLNLRELHDNSCGALLKVDLEYGILSGETSHHEDWPLAPTHICPDPEWFSEYQRRMADVCGFKSAQKTKKLMSVIGPRKEYLIHSSLLEFYLEKGMTVTRFHGGVKYSTAPWLKPYVDYLMIRRQQTKIPFMSTYLKLQSNSLYGSFLRRPRNDRTIKICQSQEEFREEVSRASYKTFRAFSEDMCAVECVKKVVTLNQPIFVASAVLDNSKLHITKLFWEMKSYFSSQDKKMECIAFDTDSIVCKITTPELDKDLKALEHIFDFSSLPTWHPLHDKSKERVPGYLKIELGNQTITEMVAIKSKCYALKYVKQQPPQEEGSAESGSIEPAEQIMRRCKGVPSVALKKDVGFEEYRNCVFKGFIKEVEFFAIKSDGMHNVYTVQQQKRGLSAFDNKRKILSCGIRTLPYCVGQDGREMPWPEEKEREDPDADNLRELVELMDTEEHGADGSEEMDEGADNLIELLALWDSDLFDQL